MTQTYDSKQVIVIVGGNYMQGLADGTFLNIVPNADDFTKVVGADGNVARSKSNDASFRVTLTLMQTSASNDVLSALRRSDKIANAGIVPIQVKDLGGRTLFSAPECWVARPPDSEFGKELSQRQWMLDTGPAEYFVGGNS